MGEENMIVTPLAPRDITHTTVTVKIECSQRRVKRRHIFHEPKLSGKKARCMAMDFC